MPDIKVMPEVKGIVGAEPGIPASGIHNRDRDPKRIAEAARQFESLLIGELLKASHGSSGSGWMGTGDDQAGAQALDLAEEQLAQTLAQQGGLGLAKLVVAGLRQKAEAASAKSNDGAPLANGPGGSHPALRAGSASGEGGPSAGGGSSTRNAVLAPGGALVNPSAFPKSSNSIHMQRTGLPAVSLTSNSAAQKLQP